MIRKTVWAMMLPVPYLLFFPLLLWITLVMPLYRTLPTVLRLREVGYDVSQHSLIGWMLNDARIRAGILFQDLLRWPRSWGRGFGRIA